MGYLRALYAQANPDLPQARISVTERTLSNSMDYASMQKTAWKTVTGDDKDAKRRHEEAACD